MIYAFTNLMNVFKLVFTFMVKICKTVIILILIPEGIVWKTENDDDDVFFRIRYT